MTTTADQIYELVKSMPEQNSRIVLVFAQFVVSQLNPERHQVPSRVTEQSRIKDQPSFCINQHLT
jgi:hypothetical protein